MAPAHNSGALGHPTYSLLRRSDENTFGDWRKNGTAEGFVTEGWGQGFMLGSLVIMACITVANMRKGVLLHKLILLELVLAMGHGTFCFMAFHGYGWYLSGTAALLYCSYFVHNVVAWIKIRPFFGIKSGSTNAPQASFTLKTCNWVQRIYLSTLAMTIPGMIFQAYNNFRFFNNLSELYRKWRPYEPVFRDPWWLFSVLTLFYVIRRSYSNSALILIRKSPRFGILIAAICLSMAFTIMDILASIIPSLSSVDGINPYWKLTLVFKCLSDNIMLDDFQTALDKLRGAARLGIAGGSQHTRLSAFATNEKPDGFRTEVEDCGRRLMPSRPHPDRYSISGRALDSDEVLDVAGRGRRKQSMAAKEAVGRVGTRISQLPSISKHMRSGSKAKRRAETEANTRENMNMGMDRNLGMDMEESVDPAILDLNTSPVTTFNGPYDRQLCSSMDDDLAGPSDRGPLASSEGTDNSLLDRDERWLPAMADLEPTQSMSSKRGVSRGYE